MYVALQYSHSRCVQQNLWNNLLFKVCWAGLKAAVVGCKCVSLLLLPSIHKSSIISVPNLHPVHFMELDVCGPNVKYSSKLNCLRVIFQNSVPCHGKLSQFCSSWWHPSNICPVESEDWGFCSLFKGWKCLSVCIKCSAVNRHRLTSSGLAHNFVVRGSL